MLLEQMPDQPARRRALAPFRIELGFEGGWHLD
jgi:hypothetical protein